MQNIKIKFDDVGKLYLEGDGDADPAIVEDIPTSAILTVDFLSEDEHTVDIHILDSTPFNGSKYLSLIDRVALDVNKARFTELE